MRRSNTWRASCCGAMAWCAGACSSAKPTGCRPGATSCACTGAWRPRANCAAAASWRPRRRAHALPEAVAALRAIRKRPVDGEWIVVAASDPLNLVGTLLPGEKLPRKSWRACCRAMAVGIARSWASRWNCWCRWRSRRPTGAAAAVARSPGGCRRAGRRCRCRRTSTGDVARLTSTSASPFAGHRRLAGGSRIGVPPVNAENAGSTVQSRRSQNAGARASPAASGRWRCPHSTCRCGSRTRRMAQQGALLDGIAQQRQVEAGAASARSWLPSTTAISSAGVASRKPCRARRRRAGRIVRGDVAEDPRRGRTGGSGQCRQPPQVERGAAAGQRDPGGAEGSAFARMQVGDQQRRRAGQYSARSASSRIGSPASASASPSSMPALQCVRGTAHARAQSSVLRLPHRFRPQRKASGVSADGACIANRRSPRSRRGCAAPARPACASSTSRRPASSRWT